MIEIRRNDIESECAVCGRTLLLGEKLVTYHRPAQDDARVCELCLDQADAAVERAPARPAGVPQQPPQAHRRADAV
jgi:hypothetical protein